MIKLFGSSQILKKDETLVVSRKGAVVYKDGKPLNFNIHKFEIKANVQPLNGRQLEMVPEHDRFKEQYWLFLNNANFKTQNGLEYGGPMTLLPNDVVLRPDANYNQIKFQVQDVEQWGSYVKCRIVRIDVGPDSIDSRVSAENLQ